MNADGKLFALHVKGEAHADASIHDGDIIVMKKQDTAKQGELVAAWLTDRQQTTLRRFYRRKGKVELHSVDGKSPVIEVVPHNVTIQGKVVLVIRKLAPGAEVKK